MFLTADSINQIFYLTSKEGIYEDILRSFFTRPAELDEFRQHIWLQIAEQPRQKIIDAWNSRWFKYLYSRIVTNQIKSRSSSWWRQNAKERFGDPQRNHQPKEIVDEDCEDFEIEKEFEQDFTTNTTTDDSHRKMLVIKALDHYSAVDPKFFVERNLFELYYFKNMSLRDIEKHTQLINGERISFQAVRECIQYAEVLVRHHIRQNKNKHI